MLLPQMTMLFFSAGTQPKFTQLESIFLVTLSRCLEMDFFNSVIYSVVSFSGGRVWEEIFFFLKRMQKCGQVSGWDLPVRISQAGCKHGT